MKKYIREMIDDLRRGSQKIKPAKAAEINMNPAAEPALPRDLENQILSTDPKERVRQLDFQAQRNEQGEGLD